MNNGATQAIQTYSLHPRKEDDDQNIVEYTIDSATATSSMKIITYVFLGVSSILYGILVIYLAIYAYSNPDPPHCYYIAGLDTPAITKSTALILAREEEIPVRDGYPVDIAHLFRAWFIWGFWGSIYQIVVLCVFLPLACLCTHSIHILYVSGAIAELLSCFNTMAWLVLGFFWRYSSGGSTVSGDKLEKLPTVVTNEEWKAALEKARIVDGY